MLRPTLIFDNVHRLFSPTFLSHSLFSLSIYLEMKPSEFDVWGRLFSNFISSLPSPAPSNISSQTTGSLSNHRSSQAYRDLATPPRPPLLLHPLAFHITPLNLPQPSSAGASCSSTSQPARLTFFRHPGAQVGRRKLFLCLLCNNLYVAHQRSWVRISQCAGGDS